MLAVGFLVFMPLRSVAQRDTLTVMFYNVENFFDTHNDSLTRDDDFTPEGFYRWTYSRYKQKATKTARVILSANGWKPPSLVGLCEVENAVVLRQLLYGGGLANAGYSFVHFDSPDARGIDVALLYNRYLYKILEKRPISLSNKKLRLKTRDALYVKAVYGGTDTLHVVVNHWPSKLGGEKSSEPGRNHAAQSVRNLCDSIRSTHSEAKLILMGDFNDEAGAYAITQILGAQKPETTGALLFNLSVLAKEPGSYKYQGSWGSIDHIIISRSLWMSENPAIFRVVNLPYLLEEDVAFSGYKPFRTYLGARYIGGYSDHLPVIAHIVMP